MAQIAKTRFTISLTQDTYDHLRAVAGPRGGGAYIEQLLKRNQSNENNINSIVIRMDTMEHLINKLTTLIAILFPDKGHALLEKLNSDADLSYLNNFMNM